MLHFSRGPFSHIVAMYITNTGARRIRNLNEHVFMTDLGIKLATFYWLPPLGVNKRQNYKSLHVLRLKNMAKGVICLAWQRHGKLFIY